MDNDEEDWGEVDQSVVDEARAIIATTPSENLSLAILLIEKNVAVHTKILNRAIRKHNETIAEDERRYIGRMNALMAEIRNRMTIGPS